MLFRAAQLRQQHSSGQLSLEDYGFFIDNLRSAFRNLVSHNQKLASANLEENYPTPFDSIP